MSGHRPEGALSEVGHSVVALMARLLFPEEAVREIGLVKRIALYVLARVGSSAWA